MCTFLERANYLVLEADGRATAFEIGSRHPGFDLAASGARDMPGGNEKYLHARLLPDRPELQVLYMWGHTDGAIVRHGVLDGDTPFVRKPLTRKTLLAKVRATLEGCTEPERAGPSIDELEDSQSR